MGRVTLMASSFGKISCAAGHALEHEVGWGDGQGGMGCDGLGYEGAGGYWGGCGGWEGGALTDGEWGASPQARPPDVAALPTRLHNINTQDANARTSAQQHASVPRNGREGRRAAGPLTSQRLRKRRAQRKPRQLGLCLHQLLFSAEGVGRRVSSRARVRPAESIIRSRPANAMSLAACCFPASCFGPASASDDGSSDGASPVFFAQHQGWGAGPGYHGGSCDGQGLGLPLREGHSPAAAQHMWRSTSPLSSIAVSRGSSSSAGPSIQEGKLPRERLLPYLTLYGSHCLAASTLQVRAPSVVHSLSWLPCMIPCT